MSRTGWGLTIGAAALLVAGSLTGLRELVVVGLGGVLAVVVGLVFGRRRPSITVERAVDPARATVGDVALARVTLRNDGTRPTASIMFEERVGDERRDLVFRRLAPGQSRSVTYRLPTDRRTVMQLGPGSIRSGDPFGVVDAGVAVGETAEIVVHPRRLPISSYPRASRRAIDGPEAQQAALGSMVFHTLREYVPGDDLRHVHWKSSARTGSLMVRQYVDTDIPELTVVLDVARTAYDPDGDGFEAACEAAASIIEAFHRQGFSVRLMTSGGTSVASGPETLHLLDLIARLDTVGVADLNSTLRSIAVQPRGIGVAVLTGVADDTVVRQVTGLRGRDRAVVLVEIRPDAGMIPVTSRGDLQRLQAVDGDDFARSWNGMVRW